MQFPKDSEFVCVDRCDDALYEQALSWVNEKRRVAFISDQERVISDPRIKIYVLETPLQLDGLIKQIAWSAALKKLTAFGECKARLEECHLAARLILAEAADLEVQILQNGRANCRPYRRGLDLKGAFTNIPALIVGAGPSLEKNGHLLKEFENKALIFAGGSALNAIDIEPHFAGAIDPTAPLQSRSRAPLCYQSRMHPANDLQGAQLLFPDGFSDALNWLFETQEPFDSGWTVGNFLMAAALHMGCSPIVLAGMDFCYAGQKKYARGPVQAGGQPDWLLAAKWTEQRLLINATEGGILQLPEEKLETVLQRLTTQHDLRKQVDEAIQRLPLHTPSRWPEWDASLQRLRCKLDEDEIAYEKLLLPLWQIWKPIFEREVEEDPRQKIEGHRMAFFRRILEAHS